MERAVKILRNVAPHAMFIFLAAAAAYFLIQGAAGDSATREELANIPAGYGYTRYMDYRLDPGHPPLAKALAALPLLAESLNFPTGNPAWQKEVNGGRDVGYQFLYESGNDADRIIFLSRLFPIFLTLLTLLFIYLWGRELLGRWWALLPATLFAFSPIVLAHGHYVTTDVAAAFGILTAVYAFVKWFLRPTARRLILAGIAFGVAQLMEFSALLLIPAFVLLAIIFFWGEAHRRGTPSLALTARSALAETGQASRGGHRPRGTALAGSLLLVFALGAAVIYAGYFVTTFHYPAAKQITDTSSLLSSAPPLARSALTQMAGNPMLRPFAEYALGITMALQRPDGGNPTYFFGNVSSGGRWYHSPVTFLLKEPLPVLLFLLLALGLSVKTMLGGANGRTRRRAFADYLGTHFAEFPMLAVVVLYAASSVKNPSPIGARYVLTVLPLLYLLAAGGLKSWAQRGKTHADAGTKEGKLPPRTRWKMTLVIALVFWQAAETVLAAPFFLSYFNEAAGGMGTGYRYATDSNYDWGQDLKRLAAWVRERGDIQRIAVDYFGGGDPRFYLGGTAEGWWSARGDPRDIGIEWFAVSVNTLQGAMQPVIPPLARKPEDEYRWLRELRPPEAGLGELPTPDFRAGTSIFIYHL
ncbi:MAG: glycosyltransferase family 39 protein [Candidatus Jorgensenbacteria bacterium]